MQFYTIIQDFTGVYQEQPFMQQLRGDAEQARNNSKEESCEAGQSQGKITWMDCTQISGTDCYCDDEAQAELNRMMDKATSEAIGDATVHAIAGEKISVHFFDNGNYHYMSKLWTDHIQEPFDLVVFDHHPDMQPPRFEGILSCGGWIKEVLDTNPNVKQVLLIGVADHLIEELKQEPAAEFEMYSHRVKFIPESEVVAALACSADGAIPSFESYTISLETGNVYISIDKDALSTKEAVTNWDQGSLTFAQLEQALRTLFANNKVLGVDICGERACNQDYPDGMDESKADFINNQLNASLFKTLEKFNRIWVIQDRI